MPKLTSKNSKNSKNSKSSKSSKSSKNSKSSKSSKSSKTRKAPCEVCTTRRVSKKSGLYKLRKGDTHLRAYLPHDATLRENSNAKETVKLEGLKPISVFFYFATNSNSKDFTQPVQHFTDAYDKLQNSGVVKTNANGEATVHVNCPQVYLADDGQIYSRHFHIIYWQSKAKKWDTRIYTHQIFCNVDKAFVKKVISAKTDVIIIDALDESYFSKEHIPGAINLPSKHKWTLEEVKKKMPKGIHSTTPIIIYCYSPKCNAAEKLWVQMNRLGFYNTMHYSGGISDWLGK
jgi:rhodanese-related sulfurtransferase